MPDVLVEDGPGTCVAEDNKQLEYPSGKEEEFGKWASTPLLFCGEFLEREREREPRPYAPPR